MTAALRDLFAAAADDERAAARPLDVDALLTQAHRRRTAHATAYSAIGLGVAAAVTFGAVSADGLWRDDEPPVPPATESPAPRPTQTPEVRPTPTVTPTEVAWAPDWNLCGMPSEDLFLRDTAADEEGGWAVGSTWSWETSVPVDAPFSLELIAYGGWNEAPNAPDASIADVHVVDVVAVAYDEETDDNGAVVGVAAVPVDVVGHGQTDNDDGLPLEALEMSFVSCSASPLTGGDGSLDTTLADGDYHVVALADVTPEGGQTVTAVSIVGFLGEVEPVEPWAGYSPTPTQDTYYLTAGTPLQLTADRTWNQTLDEWRNTPHDKCIGGWDWPVPDEYPDSPVQITGTPFLRDGELIVHVTLTNTSDVDLSESFVRGPQVFVARDGQRLGFAFGGVLGDASLVPAGPFPEGQQYDIGIWPAGQAYEVELTLGRTNCLGEPWDAGTYDFHVGGWFAAPWRTFPTQDVIQAETFAAQIG